MKLRNLVHRFALALALLSFGQALAQTTAPGPQPSVRIVAPRQGEKLSTNFVTVRFELLNPGASANSSPNYQVRLDGRDPVRTTDVEFTFSGLTPGPHTILVELVDANATPINGTRVQVRFHVSQQPMPIDAAPDHTDIVRQTASLGTARMVPAVFTWVEREQAPAEPEPVAAETPATARHLPRSSSALPLLSVIGFGALMGGLASAMRTR